MKTTASTTNTGVTIWGNKTAHSTNFAFANNVTFNLNPWGYPEFSKFVEYSDRVEVFYKQHRMINSWPAPTDQERVYKIIFSCKDGVWHKSDPIYGKVIPAQSEYFEFEDNEQ